MSEEVQATKQTGDKLCQLKTIKKDISVSINSALKPSETAWLPGANWTNALMGSSLLAEAAALPFSDKNGMSLPALVKG
ncbi:MAG: hypothetical protein E7H57_10685 [Pantoea sp.]|nr:hypothetical protein [Pantoea sp.]